MTNERARDLHRQAFEYCIENAQGAPVAWEYEDKVSELIIQECIKVAEQNYDLKTSLAIKKHFGM